MTRTLLILLTLACGCFSARSGSAASCGGESRYIRPAPPELPKGRLVAVGGGEVPAEALKMCLSGNKGRVLIITTATSEPEQSFSAAMKRFEDAGAKSVIQFNSVEQISNADVIWFTGGDQNKITKAHRGTAEFLAFYRAGGVIGGTSAGAAMMGDLMITGEGDFSKIEAGAVEIAPGMEFLPGFIFDQHFIKRKRMNRLVSAILANKDHVGIGIDEGAALMIEKGKLTVIHGNIIVMRSSRDIMLQVLRESGTIDLP